MRGLVGFLLVVCSVTQASAQFSGRFVGSGLDMTLKKEGAGYAGTVLTDGQTLKVQAKSAGNNQISGSYYVFGIPIPFQASLSGTTMTLFSAGTKYVMQKQGVKKPVKPPERSFGKSAGEARQVGSAKRLEKFRLKSGEVGDKFFGVKFRPPKGWEARKSDDGYLLVSKTQKGFLAIVGHEYKSLAQMRQEAQSGLQEEGGTSLLLQGDLKPVGKNGLAAKYTGTLEGKAAASFVVGLLSPNGGGVTVMAMVEAASYSVAYEKLARSLAASVVFTRRESRPVNAEWKRRLNDVRLTYMWSYYSGGGGGSYVGGSQETKIDLCSQGYFRYKDKDQMSVDGGGGSSGYSHGGDQGNGAWEVVNKGAQPVLRLKFHDGRVFEYNLSMKDGKVHLNGKKYFKTNSSSMAEYRPQCF